MTPIRKFPFSPILGWSASRYDTFLLCKRKYYYRYYAKFDPKVPVRQIDELKALSSIPMAIGSTVHEVIEDLLNRLRRTAEDIDRARFSDHVRRETAAAIARTTFQEVRYGERAAVRVEDMLPKVETCLENLLDSSRYRWLVEEAIHTSDRWVIDPPGYGETRMDEMKVYFKVDFLFPVGERLHILDWKTGKRDDDTHRKQLMGYSAWAVFHFNVAPDQVQSAVAYLFPEYAEEEHTFTAVDLQNFSVRVRAETDEMYEYLRDVDQNIPVDKPEFARVDDARICPYCEFRGLCFPERYPLA